MKSELDMLKIIANGQYEVLFEGLDTTSINVIKSKVNEIPSYFFEQKFSAEDTKNAISIVEFSLQTVNMSKEKRNGLMDKYHISPYDVKKLQDIVNSIRVASEYASFKPATSKNDKNAEKQYGFALSDESKLNVAYPLWIAYTYMNSMNPMEDVKNRLYEDGMDGKYTPEYIVSLMDHANSLMIGKSNDEKKDFYMSAISEILDGKKKTRNKDEFEVEI